MPNTPDQWAPSAGAVPGRARGGRPRGPKHDVVMTALETGGVLRREFADPDEARRYVAVLRRVAKVHGAKLNAGYVPEGDGWQAVVRIYREAA